MHALSKKHYYDVIKSTQEDTILESDISIEDCKQEGNPTSDVGCYARSHLKSNSVQTCWYRNNKNFRNQCTITSEKDSGMVALDSLFSRGGNCIPNSQTYEGVATICSSSQTTGTSHQEHPLLKTGTASMVVERAVECVDFFQHKNGLPLESKATITAKHNDEFTQYECVKSKMGIGECEYQCIPSNRGLAACRTFSLGSPESRRLYNQHCKTKLIGGCRVPVCKNYKNRF